MFRSPLTAHAPEDLSSMTLEEPFLLARERADSRWLVGIDTEFDEAPFIGDLGDKEPSLLERDEAAIEEVVSLR